MVMALASSPRFSFMAGPREQVLPNRVSASLHASTSAAACSWLRHPPRHDHHPPPRGFARVLAKRRTDGHDWDEDNREARTERRRRSKDAGGFQFTNGNGMFRIRYNEYKAEVRQDEAWKLLIPLVGGMVLAAAVIGPLIIGVAFSAVAIGAALSAGALFTSLFLPFFIFIGMGALFFGGVTFSAFATLGTALLLPKLIAMAVVAGGLGLGALAVSLFLRPAADKAKESYAESGSRRGAERRTIDVTPEEEEEEGRGLDPEVDRQLREFDELLAGRDEQRQRAEKWKSGGGGGSGRR